MVAETGCQGVMIGRAALTNPWIFRQVLEPELQVTELQRIQLCLDFMRLLQDLLEPREALHKMKKIGGWFTKGIPGGSAFRQNLHEISDPAVILAKLEAMRDRAS